MKKILSFLHWRHLKHILHEWKKVFSHPHIIRNFFHTKNGRLAVVLIIAAAIPITVLAAQQVQEIRQQAAGRAACDGVSAGLLAEPRPAMKGQKIVFKHTEVNDLPPIDQRSFDEWDSFGNGVISSSCKLVGDTIECEARGTAKAGQISKHTWQFRELAECEYEVKNGNPKSNPTPTTPGQKSPTPTRPAGGACTGELSDALCTVDNKPRLRASWNLRGGTEGKCQVMLEQGNSKWVITDKCDNKSGYYLDSDKDSKKIELKPATKYKLTIVNGAPACNKVSEATTANCKRSTTPSPEDTPKPEDTTTPPPSNTTCKKTDVHLDKAGSTCTGKGEIRISGGWEISGTNCVVTLYEDGNSIGTQNTCKNKAWYKKDGLSSEKTYQLKATSDICTDVPLESAEVVSKACTPPEDQTPGSFGADWWNPFD